MEFLAQVILCAFWIWGVYGATDAGMILSKPANYLWERYPSWVVKPLLGCAPCMASVHGTLFWLWFCEGDLKSLLPFIVCVSGLNYVIKEFLFNLFSSEK